MDLLTTWTGKNENSTVLNSRAAAMEREMIGSGIQLLSIAMGITGITLQRKAMMADPHEDDFVLVHSPVLYPEDEEDFEQYGAFEVNSRRNEDFIAEFEKHNRVKRCRRCRVMCNRLKHVSKVWLFGFVIYYVSQVIEMLALSFASQSTLVAVGSLGGFINALVAVKVFHETFQFLPPKTEPTLIRKILYWDFLNLCIMVSGSVLTVLFAPLLPREEEKSFTAAILLHKWIEVPFVFYFATGGVIALCLIYRFFFIQRGPLPLAITMAFNGSISVTMSKVVTELIQGNHVLTFQALAMVIIWVGILLSQIIFLQIGLRNFEQSGAFSVSSVLGGALTITAGMLYFKTYENFENDHDKIGFTCGVSLLLYGILMFSQRKNVSKAEMKRRLLADVATLEEEELRRAAQVALERSRHDSSEEDDDDSEGTVCDDTPILEQPLLA